MIHRAETSRGTLAVGLAVLLATCALGCDGAQGRTGTNLAPPIAPSRNEALADRWYHAWEKQEDVVADSEVRDMFFVLGTRGRDWRKPEGPDGYPVRVFLLDGLGRPIRAEGALHAFLVSSPLDVREKRPICAWSVSAEQTGKFFQEERIPGYLLRFDWGAGPPQATAEFMLVIRWVSSDGKCRVTRNIVFNDRIEHVITTTTSRPKAP